MNRNFAVYFFPGIVLFIYLLMTFLPFIDPLRKNIEKSKDAYFHLKTLLVCFFSLIYIYSLFAAFNGEESFQFNLLFLPTFGFLILAMGFLMPSFKKNCFMGIRTPWTLESEEVWNKTHKRAKKWYIAGGLFVVIGGLLQVPFWWIFGLMMGFLLWPVADSYFIWKKVRKEM